MIAVADASPVNYLVLIDQSHLLPALYGRVFMPLAVATELNRAGTPEPVRWWITDRPEWLEVRRVKRMSSDMPSFLDPGEREAIALSQEINADVLRIDEWDGREEALRAPDKGRGYFTGSGERSREVFGGDRERR